jgi:hypothetical protein
MGKPKPKRRWLHLTPDRFLLALLALEGFLLLSEWFCWFPFNEKKGWTVLFAVGAILVGGLLLLLWFGVSLILRRRLQFGVRSLLAMVLAVAVACSWLGVKLQQASKQKEAVEAIEEERVWVFYEGTPPLNPKPSEPTWLRTLLGGAFFDRVVGVHWLAASDTDAGLEHIGGLGQLQWLSLDYAQVTDAGLEHLRGLAQLKALSLRNAHVTDAGLERLRNLAQLESLDLSNTHVTDAGLIDLKCLMNLQAVNLSGTKVTDDDVEELRRALPNCRIHKDW